MEFYHLESIVNLVIDYFLQQMSSNIYWSYYLDIFTCTYKQPMLEFLSTYAQDDTTEVLTFWLYGRHHRLIYDTLNTIMGTYNENNTTIYIL